MEFYKRTWAAVDLNRISHNMDAIRAHIGDECKVMAVVKADAYGHGYRNVSLTLQERGADWFGVSNIDEALCLREAGITQPVLIFGPTPAELVHTLCRNHLTQTVYSPEYAYALNEHARRKDICVDVHIKIDTGMHRLGLNAARPEEALALVREIKAMPHLSAQGIFTHLAVADEDSEESVRFTNAQFDAFMQLLSQLAKQGISFPLRHCCNSAGMLRYPRMHLDMVRPGLALYGLYPAPCCKTGIELLPAMEIKSLVSMVKTIRAGDTVSYGRLYTANDTLKIATIPIGYADGYHRLMSNRGRMIVCGQYANVVGRVCMDQLMLDVTGIDGVCEGVPVTVFGRENGLTISVEELADTGGTVSYEIICLIGKRVPRIYIKDGVQTACVDHMRDGLPCNAF